MAYLLDQLNHQQRLAVEQTEGPLLILAGAGSGKTRVITYRIAYLMEAKGVPPESILAVTFTNKAADQMRERVAKLLAGRIEIRRGAPHLSTFHSFCVSVLRRRINRLGYSNDFSIYDEEDQQRLMKACIIELGLEQEFSAPRGVLAKISYEKNHSRTPQELYTQAFDPKTERVAALYERYETKLRAANALDFDDLLLRTAELFDQSPEAAEEYNQRFRYMLVDEYQDTNRIQYRLIRQLTQAHHNLCVVGDEDQSIYRWRGADIANILNFEQDYPEARLIRLEQNYRSTQSILDAAGAVVARNLARKGKTLWTDRGRGEKVSLYEASDADEEAFFVAGEVARELSDDEAASIAVLYRTNAQSRVLEEALRRNGTDYRMVGGFSFYNRQEIKDALAYARLANNLRDSAALLRIINVPARGVGDSTLNALAETARSGNLSLWEALEEELHAQRLPARALKALASLARLVEDLVADRGRLTLSEFLDSVLTRSGYWEMLRQEDSPESQDRLDNLRELLNAARSTEEQGERLAQFLDHAALVSDQDDYDERARVTLMTLHSAKGLEFSTVFLVGLEEGLLPHKLSINEQEGLEEERRLCYVGMTRAKDRLFVSWAGSRRSYGQESLSGTRPSRFLSEIPAQLLTSLSPRESVPKPRTTWANALNSAESVQGFLRERGRGSARRQSTARWKLGTQVRHPKYGIGTVLDCEGEGEDTKLTVSFPGYGQKKLVERYASLEKA